MYGINNPIINSCLINKYRNSKDYISPHRDTNISFGEYPTIAGLSIGSEREIVLMDPLAASQRSDNKKKDKKE